MFLEGRELGHLLEADRGLAFPGTAGVSAACGQVGQEGIEAMHGPAVVGLLGALFAAGTLGRLRFGHGVAGPAVGVEFVALEQHGRAVRPWQAVICYTGRACGQSLPRDVGATVCAN